MNPTTTVKGSRKGVLASISMSSRRAAAWSSIGKNPRSAPVSSRNSPSVRPATAFGVLHHHDRVDPENVAGQGEAAQDVFGHPPSRIADHVGLAEVEPQSGEHIDPGIHTGQHGDVAPRAGIGHVGACRGIAFVGGKQLGDLAHEAETVTAPGTWAPMLRNRATPRWGRGKLLFTPTDVVKLPRIECSGQSSRTARRSQDRPHYRAREGDVCHLMLRRP